MSAHDQRLASRYLDMLSEETARRAWGETARKDRENIALAAVIFSRRLEESLSRSAPDRGDFQKFLMRLMNEVVSDFAESRDISPESASEMLGDVGVRDRILEFNEVIEAYEDDESRSLDRLLMQAVEERERRAGWSDHWSNG